MTTYMYMQVHPQHSRNKLGISDKMIAEVEDSESPLEFWQLRAPTDCIIRRPALRIHSGKASALGVERLWSGARLIFTDNRRSLATRRVMQLLNLKCNSFLLDGHGTHQDVSNLVEEIETEFESIFEDVALAEEAEVAADMTPSIVDAQNSGEMEDGIESDAVENADDDTELVDLFAMD